MQTRPLDKTIGQLTTHEEDSMSIEDTGREPASTHSETDYELDFFVIGEPGPQGSKRHVGGGRMIESSKKVKPWRDSVAWCAREAMCGRSIIGGPVIVDMIFTLRKPQSAPKRRKSWADKKPDLSKLARSTEDALTTAGVYEDDARIVEYGRLAKVFPGEDPDALHSPGCVIRIRRAKAVCHESPLA